MTVLNGAGVLSSSTSHRSIYDMKSSPNPNAHPDFDEALSLSSDLTAHLRNLDLSRLMYRAAVIDRQHIRSPVPEGWETSSGPDGDGVERGEKGKGKGKARTEWAQLDIMGWSKFVQSLERQHAALEQLSSRTHTADPRDSPLPPILSSLTLAKIVLSASTPITGVRVVMGSKAFVQKPHNETGGGWAPRKAAAGPPGKKGGGAAKGGEEVVDVICRGGAEWIKLWTKKESQMMAEFREQDSYQNSDWSDSDSEDDLPLGSSSKLPQKAPTRSTTPPLSNSLLTTARSLLSLTQTTPRRPGALPPTLTIRLTRIPTPSPEGYPDSRMSETFSILRSLGINLQFGDFAHIPLSSLPHLTPPPSALLPSLKINLDPTALVGLCADALHHPVPTNMDQARGRYFRPRRYLHQASASASASGEGSKPGSGTATPNVAAPIPSSDGQDDTWLDGYDDHRQSQHSRELLKEALDEVSSPLITELRDTLERDIAAASAKGMDSGPVEFWTTEGALQHLREAMSNTRVVGEGMEQQRMRRLIGDEEGDFWEGSRYEGKEGCLRGLRVRVFDGRPDGTGELPQPKCVEGLRSFHLSTAAATRQFLSEYQAILANPSLLQTTHSDIPPFLRPDRLPVPKVAELSVSLPIVSMASMQRGAEEGMTTLCMGNVVWREMFAQGRWKVRGWTQGDWELERERMRAENAGRGDESGVESAQGGERAGEKKEDVSGEDQQGEEDDERDVVGEGEGEGNAVIWLMPYRSLGEGKRVRFEKKDYSFPVPK